MAQREFTLSLNESTFPMISDQQGRTIIGNVDRSAYDNTIMAKIYYCHNVMPTLEGVKSIGYNEVISAISPAITNYLTDVRTIYSNNRARTYMAWDSTGKAYVLDLGSTTWIGLSDTTPSTISASFSINDVTLGRVNGITYIFYKGIGCFIYNDSTKALDAVTLTGLTIANIIGVTGSFGYLIAYSETDITWSSTIDPTDFTPSDATGSGGGSVTNLGGAILFILPNSLGILIFSDTNVIAATYTGNIRYPFKFREVDDSKGGLALDLAAYEANASNQFVITKGGIQSINSQKASIIFPEITDFLSGKKLEDFDETTQTFTTTTLTATMMKKVKFIASRYFVVSYGVTGYTHALVFDIALKRMGKLKIDHVDIFDYIGAQTEIAKESIAILLADGTIKTVDFSVGSTTNGVIMFGKLQYSRTRTFTIQQLDIENVESAASLSAYVFNSLDGKTTSKKTLAQSYNAEGIRKFNATIAGLNQSILLIGDFDLNTILVTYTLGGRR